MCKELWRQLPISPQPTALNNLSSVEVKLRIGINFNVIFDFSYNLDMDFQISFSYSGLSKIILLALYAGEPRSCVYW